MFSNLWITLIRTAFWLLYHPFAWIYDGVSYLVSLGHWRDWQRTALPELVGPQVLELGFGPGHMLAELSAAGMDIVGLDRSAAMVRLAHRKISVCSVPLIHGDARQLPFADRSFNSVLATFPAPFVLEPSTLHEIARVLVPGGRFVIVAAGVLTGHDLVSRFLEWLYRVTAQREPLPDLSPVLEDLGMTSRTKWTQVAHTKVLLIVLTRS